MARGHFSLGHDRFDRMINVVLESKLKHEEKEPLERERERPEQMELQTPAEKAG